jgi:hypothetical protein
MVVALDAQGYGVLEIAMRAHLHCQTVNRILEHQRRERRQKPTTRKES